MKDGRSLEKNKPDMLYGHTSEELSTFLPGEKKAMLTCILKCVIKPIDFFCFVSKAKYCDICISWKYPDICHIILPQLWEWGIQAWTCWWSCLVISSLLYTCLEEYCVWLSMCLVPCDGPLSMFDWVLNALQWIKHTAALTDSSN